VIKTAINSPVQTSENTRQIFDFNSFHLVSPDSNKSKNVILNGTSGTAKGAHVLCGSTGKLGDLVCKVLIGDKP